MSTILRWQEVKTRKPHRCFGCAKEYPPKSKMIDASYADNNTVYSCYWCRTCEEYIHRHFRYGDETGYGEIYDNDTEEWEVIKREQKGKKNDD